MTPLQSRNQVLIIDRDVAGIEPLRLQLGEAGFQVRIIADLQAAIATLCLRPPHLLVIDWDVPTIAPPQVIKNVRALPMPASTRLMIASALAGEENIVAALSLGADDFLTKPFSVREMVARVSRVLRAGAPPRSGGLVRFDALELDSAAKRILAQGVSLYLRRIECRLLEFLMLHNGRTFSRHQLLNQVWGGDAEVDERTVDVNVQRLRKLLASQGYESCIQTVRGFGYRFAAPAPPAGLSD